MLQYNDFSALGIDEEVSGKCVMADFSRDPDRDKPSQPTEMHEALLCGIGRLIFSWGKLEVHLEQKVAQLRQNAGDVRATARIRPTMAKMLAELRAIVSMRNRRNRSEEHTSELQSLMRISYAVFCLKKQTLLKQK